MGNTYYVDSSQGRPENSGCAMDQPVSDYRTLKIAPGDTVLFKRGTVTRCAVNSPDGEPGKVITFGAYGEGPKPIFMGSVNLSDASDWEESSPHIWRYTGTIPNEVCNLIFDHDRQCGVLAWTVEDLDAQGKWYYSLIGKQRNRPASEMQEPAELLLYSVQNPGEYYQEIECAIFGERKMLSAQKYVTFENLVLKYSGVHAYGQANADHVTIRNCEFYFIGGCVWDRHQRIRFGNGIELWDYGQDFVLDGCVFDNVYDSCVTHQGGSNCRPPERVFFVNNIFKNYGMGAYEARDRIGIDTHFDGNICIGAGLGFSLQGETPPRKSELWPQPMGHHLFIWRIHHATEGGQISVRNNVFYESPYGAAVYSTIAPEAEAQFDFANNRYYQTKEEYLIRWNGTNYGSSEFETYKRETGNDKGSVFVKPCFIDEAHGDYRLAAGVLV